MMARTVVSATRSAQTSARRLALLISPLVLAACGAAAPSRERHATPPATPADSAAEALLRQVLAERITAGDIPDFGLVRHHRPILVRLDGAGRAALPELRGNSLSVISLAEAEERARRTGQPVYYLTAGAPSIHGDTAQVMLGVDVANPPGAGVKLCCCNAQVRYVRTGKRWRYLDMPYAVCS